MNFPLYTIIHEKLTDNLQPLSNQEKDRILSKIKKLDNIGHEHLYTRLSICEHTHTYIHNYIDTHIYHTSIWSI